MSGARNPTPADHRMNVGAGGCGDYIGVSYHGFINTHIDALCHIFTADRQLYNGRPATDVTEDGAKTNSIEHWRDGIVTRGVLYDVPRHADVDTSRSTRRCTAGSCRTSLTLRASRRGPATRCSFARARPRSGPPTLTSRRRRRGARRPRLRARVLVRNECRAAGLGPAWRRRARKSTARPRCRSTRSRSRYMGLPLLDNANFERARARPARSSVAGSSCS